jgi:hypothetical protein|tara:strand:- start:1067 stop:1297 length:231 start_codon:yes stop_codon:yes gene_type:complete
MEQQKDSGPVLTDMCAEGAEPITETPAQPVDEQAGVTGQKDYVPVPGSCPIVEHVENCDAREGTVSYATKYISPTD